MKRLFTRETEVEQEKLASGTEFNRHAEMMQKQCLSREYHRALETKANLGLSVKRNYITE
jgi:hypothetical protein